MKASSNFEIPAKGLIREIVIFVFKSQYYFDFSFRVGERVLPQKLPVQTGIQLFFNSDVSIVVEA
jgi:hypothetical protein